MMAFHREAYPAPNGARGGAQPIYAIGDVHGRYDLLHALLGEIGHDAADRHPGVTPLLVLCGDYVDRGPSSAAVIAALTWLQRSTAIEMRLLEGNHEAMLLDFLDHPADHGRWLSVGGAETVRSYGVTLPDAFDDADPVALANVRDGLLDAMPTAHYRLLRSLEPYVEAGDYAFVHAGVAPGVPLAAQSRDDLLWIRGEFLDHPHPSNSVIVHGHTWKNSQPQLLAHRIGIDTGAYRTGVLTALHIFGDSLEIMQASDGTDRDAPGGPR